MFPRLHLNDAERGRPRPPPRNKMALLENCSLPSQMFRSGSPLMSPSSNLVSSMSSSNGGGHERSVFSQVCNYPAPSFSMTTGQEKKSARISNYQSLSAAGTLPSIAKSSSFEPSNFSHFRHLSLRKVRDEDNDWKFKQKNESVCRDVMSATSMRNQNDEITSQTSQDPEDYSTSIPLRRYRNLADASSIYSSKFRHQQSLKRAHSSLNQENISSSMDILKSLQSTNSRLHQECVTLRDEMAHTDRFFMGTDGVGNKENALKVRTESCLRLSLGDDNSCPKGLENGVECHEGKKSVLALAISPEDVVGVIGEKQFLKARRAIIDQQRVFAEQVFELHRLIKVQKLIARSPNLLLEENLCAGKPPLNRHKAKKLRSEYLLKPPLHIVKATDDYRNPDPSTECANENEVANVPNPSIKNDTSKGLVTQQSNKWSCSGNATPSPFSNNIKLPPWCFPPPGNQWLASVKSPFEEFVHKPETGPCCPTAGFVAPFYGSFNPICLNPTGFDFIGAAYEVLAYGMPVLNQSLSGSAVYRMIPYPPEDQSKDKHSSMVDINFMIPSQSLHNLLSQMSRMISSSFEKSGALLPLFPMEPALDQNDQSDEQQTQVI